MCILNFKEWVYSEEFKNFYKSQPKHFRDVIKHQVSRCGSCGDGNHFYEIQKDDDGYLWIMLHFGSRKLGHYVCTHYNKIAQDLCEKWYSNIPNKDLAFLPLNTKEGKEYMELMSFCLTYARYNHEIVFEKTKHVFGDILESHFITHNYASIENHFGHNVVIHRKGATSAKEGQLGIIPGSQGSCSYIVRGKGNYDSFMSCSHGAGRKMSRTKAKETLNLTDEIKKMEDQNIIHGIRHKNDLDEASSAYKDIQTVMEEQKDLVDIVTKLTPLGVIKG